MTKPYFLDLSKIEDSPIPEGFFFDLITGQFAVRKTEIVTIRVKSARPTENGIEYEFASQEEANLFGASYNKVPIRMIFISPE